ncbi:MAG: AbrB/MazE/SpoVT family DNA-binding domain-containing protein [Dehalococcoidia bacterium]
MVIKTTRGTAGRGRRRASPAQDDAAAAPGSVRSEDDSRAWAATSKLSSKHQVTLPAAMVRRLDLKAGDQLDLLLMNGAIWLERRPRTAKEWVARLRGSLAHVPEWRTKEDIDAWVRRERDSWDRDWDPDDPPTS